MAAGDAGAPAETQVQVRFETKLPARLRVPGTTFSVPAALNRYGLSEVVNTLLGLADEPRPFDFVVNGELLRSSLHKFLLARGISTEEAVAVEYILAARPPEASVAATHDDWVSALCCAQEHGVVASGSYDGVVRVYAAQSLGLPTEGAAREADMEGAWSAAENGVSAAPQLSIAGHAQAVTAVAVIPQGLESDASGSAGPQSLSLLTGSKDHTLRLTTVASAEPSAQTVAVLLGHTSAVQSASVSSTGLKGCSGSWDGDIKIWDLVGALQERERATAETAEEDAVTVEKGRKKRRAGMGHQSTVEVHAEASLSGHTQSVAAISFMAPSPELEGSVLEVARLASGSWDHSIKLWDTETLASLLSLNTVHPVLSLSPNGDGSGALLASAGAQRTVQIWDLRIKGSTADALQLTSHRSWVSTVQWCRHSPMLLLSASYDGSVKLWDIRSTVPLHTVEAHPKNKVRFHLIHSPDSSIVCLIPGMNERDSMLSLSLYTL